MRDTKKYEAAKIAAIRKSKEIPEPDRNGGGFGYGFILGFRAGWEANESDGAEA